MTTISVTVDEHSPYSRPNSHFTTGCRSHGGSRITCCYNDRHPPRDFEVGLRYSTDTDSSNYAAPGLAVWLNFITIHGRVGYAGMYY